MRIGTLALAAAIALGAAACNGPAVDEKLLLYVDTDARLNTYSGTPHSLDIYLFKLSDVAAFGRAEYDELTKRTSGGALGRQTVRPGEKNKPIDLGPLGSEIYTHIGVLAAYREPSGPEATRRTFEIPGDGRMKLVLGPNGIQALTEYDD